jgi:hypothetical protein
VGGQDWVDNKVETLSPVSYFLNELAMSVICSDIYDF